MVKGMLDDVQGVFVVISGECHFSS